MIKKNKVLILLGPTASGKSGIGKVLVEQNDMLQIINCDSKQIYSEIPTITAQPSIEEINEYDYKLYGQTSIYQHYSVTHWIDDAVKSIEEAIDEDKIPLLIGGTGFYIKGLIEGLDNIPVIDDEIKTKVENMIKAEGCREFYKTLSSLDKNIIGKIQPNDSYRITKAANVFFQTGRSIFDFYGEKASKLKDHEFIVTIISPPRSTLYSNIDLRFDDMIDNGVIDEVKKVQSLDVSFPAYKAHGLPELIDYLKNKISLNDAVAIAKQNTRNYAKRQTTWFKHQLKDAKTFEKAENAVNYLNTIIKVLH